MAAQKALKNISMLMISPKELFLLNLQFLKKEKYNRGMLIKWLSCRGASLYAANQQQQKIEECL